MPAKVTADSVDLKKFYMSDKKRFESRNGQPVVIGWSGNSMFRDEIDSDLKGVRSIIVPAVRNLILEGHDISLDICDRNIKWIEKEKMPGWYNGIDIFVCASRTEGTPNTLLEAMACGVPTVSTNVGIVSDALGTKGSEFILKERSVDALTSTLRQLLNNKKLLSELSEENLEQIQAWSVPKMTQAYLKFFSEMLES